MSSQGLSSHCHNECLILSVVTLNVVTLTVVTINVVIESSVTSFTCQACTSVFPTGPPGMPVFACMSVYLCPCLLTCLSLCVPVSVRAQTCACLPDCLHAYSYVLACLRFENDIFTWPSYFFNIFLCQDFVCNLHIG